MASAISTALLILFAPLLPLFLGEDFRYSVPLLRWAAPILILTGFGYLGGDLLSGADRLYLRVSFLVVAILTQAILVILLAPFFGSLGAVFALYLSTTLLAALCWRAVFRKTPPVTMD